MHTESRESRVGDGSRLERTIVLQLLREDRDLRWTRAELAAAIEADPRSVATALGRLTGDGVLRATEDGVWASRAAHRLDELGLICL
jgi:AraC-like DNA-binding protein